MCPTEIMVDKRILSLFNPPLLKSPYFSPYFGSVNLFTPNRFVYNAMVAIYLPF